ncbi:hypothetical protein [Paramaledivibacter caminithermalis]|nr:hypothetical protein [Paramaledivibacter caminithermalis]
MVPEILKTLEFYSNNDVHKPIIEALEIIKQNFGSGFRYFSLPNNIPIEGVIRSKWRKFIIEKDEQGQERILIGTTMKYVCCKL